jgi:diaminohydroxyphosphoribosylaminopyrimidine deaminase/5-amino-6-(5-phosphoribosylamino)uracil reductase
MNRPGREATDLDAGVGLQCGLQPLSTDEAWHFLLALRRKVDLAGEAAGRRIWGFRFSGGSCVPAAERSSDLLVDPASGTILRCTRPLSREAQALLDMHARHALRARADGHVVAVLGQSLDGFIATGAGHSRYINGGESLVHLHRVRALSDAIIIGVGTAVADGPRLTTRHVPGPHATRVVIDPRGRLPASSGLICDGAAATLVVRATEGPAFETKLSDQATAVCLPARDGAIAPGIVVAALAERGMTRLLVEGGGITVGRFLEAGLIERLQLAVSPLIIGSGRPALPVSPAVRLDEALRPECRHHVLGKDVLFDLHFARRRHSG